MNVEIRPIAPDEFEAWVLATASAFGGRPRPEEIEAERSVFEADRSLAAFEEGTRIVASATAASFRLTVPGGTLPTAGVTSVGVLPTHRRRGLLTALMRRQLDDVHERGEPLAALWASEPAIYGRFGYGLAAWGLELTLERARTVLPPAEATAPAGVRLLERDQALEAFPAVYEAMRVGRPGAVDRPGGWWPYRFADLASEHHRTGDLFFALYEAEGSPEGYAIYQVKRDWGAGGPEATVRLEELVAATEDAVVELWRYVLGIDLTSEVVAWNRPADEPLLHLVGDVRRLRPRLHDALWVRLVDVGVALAGRRYAVADGLDLDVEDAFCDWNAGRFRLEGGPEGAECVRTASRPEISLSAADLGAVFLGGTRLSTLARAGRVREHAEGALRRADAMFAWDRLPWCPAPF